MEARIEAITKAEDNPNIHTDKLPDKGTIPNLRDLIEFTKKSAEAISKYHGGLKALLPSFKETLDTAYISFIDIASNNGDSDDEDDLFAVKKLNPQDDEVSLRQAKQNPLITHKRNIEDFLAVVQKMEKALDNEKFQTPLFWGAITLSVLVLSAGAAMFAIPAYVAGGFVCILAGVIGLIISFVTMRTGYKHSHDKGFFSHCQDLARHFHQPLSESDDIPEFIASK